MGEYSAPGIYTNCVEKWQWAQTLKSKTIFRWPKLASTMTAMAASLKFPVTTFPEASMGSGSQERVVSKHSADRNLHSPVPRRKRQSLPADAVPARSISILAARSSSSAAAGKRLSSASPRSSPSQRVVPLPDVNSSDKRRMGQGARKVGTPLSERRRNVGNLEAASLSTPELHHASDPQYWMEEVRSTPRAADYSCHFPSTAHYLGQFSVPTAEVMPASEEVQFPSFASAMDAVCGNQSPEPDRMRRQSNLTIRLNRRGSDESGKLLRPDAVSSMQRSPTHAEPLRKRKASFSSAASTSSTSIGDVAADKPKAIESQKTAPSSPHTPNRTQHGDPWPHQDSDSIEGLLRGKQSAPASDVTASSSREGDWGMSTCPSYGTASSETSYFTRSTSFAGSCMPPHRDVDETCGPLANLKKIRAARNFLVHALCRLPSDEIGKHGTCVANLAWYTRQADAARRGILVDESRETLEFWRCISSGVILCLLINQLCPSRVVAIDLRDLEWVKADNLSRFLRSARDNLNIPPSDLFHPLDLTDATADGLLRAVHTIVTVGDIAKAHGLVPHQPLLDGCRDSGQQLAEAERTIVAAAPPQMLSGSTAQQSTRRMSFDHSAQSLLGSTRPRVQSSITFADSIAARRADDDTRLPYRDRKLSESVISLTGVAEEEEASQTPTLRFEAADFAPKNRPLSPLSKEPLRPSSMVRTPSQKRIVQEISSRNGAPNTPLLRDSLEDYRLPSSALRQNPVRRHSARAAPLSLGDHEFSGAMSLDESAEMPILGRLPFPRSASSHVASTDSPTAKRAGRHISLSGPSPDYSIKLPTSPRLTTRPDATHGHLRSSTDFPVARPPLNSAKTDLSREARIRHRHNSELGRPIAGYEHPSAISPRNTREGSLASQIKHQLVFSDEGQSSVTFQLGNCIGRGQFGSVYRALNLNTGQMVAVKRIKLEGRSEDEVTQLMREVDLLKSLVHPSVVKYEGLVRGPDVASIILEYVENGSLLHTLKAFGNFPEKLVASYVIKILEGLNYLHEMKVVHCDLKAANILTTKNGNVKLSDFGVSLNLKAAEDLKKNDAVGTPNWMAPEVIELKGASTSADVWSLGCTIIELLTSKPPYSDMLAMSAMFRIVEDEMPPLPEDISEALQDFLTQCFQKDPLLRPSAAMLVDHEWLRTTWSDHKALRSQDSVPFLKRIRGSGKDSQRARKASLGRVAGSPSIALTPDESREANGKEQNLAASMERSGSTPTPTAVLRPALDALRATSEAEGSSKRNSGSSPTASPLNLVKSQLSASPTPMMSAVDLYMRRGSATSDSPDNMYSPGLASASETERGGSDLQTPPSYMDLSAPDVAMLDEQKAHAFVKSTFSKAVQCKICRELVRRHAVLCEECGLICHASCARRVAAPCNLRAQLLMLAGHSRHSVEAARTVSPSPSRESGPASPLQQAAPSSPGLFRMPFAKYKRNSSRLSDLNLPGAVFSGVEDRTSLDVSHPNSPSSPGMASKGEAAAKEVRRARRISLLPMHLRRGQSPPATPPPPSAAVAEQGQPMSRSLSSSNSNHDGSLGYGSSISSMQSSAGVSVSMSPVGSGERRASAQAQKSVDHAITPRRRRHLSTSAAFAQPQHNQEPFLLADHGAGAAQSSATSAMKQLGRGLPAWRRPSQGQGPRPVPGFSLDESAARPDAAGESSGKPGDERRSERRHLRRISAKQDCTIM